MLNLNHPPIFNDPPRTAPDANDSKPRIYVICLASYHKGILHGVWTDATQETFIILDQIFDMLLESPTPGAKKYAIYDSRGFYGLKINPYANIEVLHLIALLISQYGLLGAKLLAYYQGNFLKAINALQENYRGKYNSELEYTKALAEDYLFSKRLRPYLNYKKFQRDIFSHTYFSVSVNGKVHIFNRD